MQISAEFHLLSILASLIVTISSANSQASSCPFHLCTPENLQCSNGRLLLDERGCPQCKCEEAYPSSRNSTCALHGCTVQLLRCVGQLRISEEGCTLCDCDDQGIKPTPGRPTRMTIPRILTTMTTTTMASNLCPDIQCNDDVTCALYKRSPITGCPICQCDDGNATDHCPNAHEFLSGEGMRRELNSWTSPKFKIILGKLKKGFVPNYSYKIILKATEDNFPFKEFLLEVGTTPHMIVTSNKRKRKMKKTKPAQPTITGRDDEGRTSGRECGAGYWNPARNPRKAQGRLIPDCTTAAMQINKNFNKTTAALFWTAPKCGCIYIRASVVDHSGQTVYLYDEDSTISPTNAPIGRLNNPLYRIVCARTISKRKKSKSKTKQRGKVRDPIAIKCCHATKKLSRKDNCDRRATAYAENFTTRFKALKRTCKEAYKACCRLFTSRVSGSMTYPSNNTALVGKHQQTRINSDVANPNHSTTTNLESNLNQNERSQKRKKKARGGKKRKVTSSQNADRQRIGRSRRPRRRSRSRA